MGHALQASGARCHLDVLGTDTDDPAGGVVALALPHHPGARIGAAADHQRILAGARGQQGALDGDGGGTALDLAGDVLDVGLGDVDRRHRHRHRAAAGGRGVGSRPRKPEGQRVGEDQRHVGVDAHRRARAFAMIAATPRSTCTALLERHTVVQALRTRATMSAPVAAGPAVAMADSTQERRLSPWSVADSMARTSIRNSSATAITTAAIRPTSTTRPTTAKPWAIRGAAAINAT